MMNKDQRKYLILSILLLAAIVAIVGFVIIPRYLPGTAEQGSELIDFTDSAWIEQYVEANVGIYASDFFVNSAFTYNLRSNKMIVTYATQKSVEEVRDHYLTLPGAVLSGRNDETSLNIKADLEGGDLRIYNYYSPISRVIEIELVLPLEEAQVVINQLVDIFPDQELEGISGFNDLISGEIFGGYVRYRYDELDEYNYPNIPIYSRAYLYTGSEDDFHESIEALRKIYPDFRHDETRGADYFRIENQIVSVSLFTTDLEETVVLISLQENNQD